MMLPYHLCSGDLEGGLGGWNGIALKDDGIARGDGAAVPLGAAALAVASEDIASAVHPDERVPAAIHGPIHHEFQTPGPSTAGQQSLMRT